jgi:hypothetical protein
MVRTLRKWLMNDVGPGVSLRTTGGDGCRGIQCGAGLVGTDAVTGIIGHQDLELMGTRVHSKESDGRVTWRRRTATSWRDTTTSMVRPSHSFLRMRINWRILT